jgi:hypothetical protein
MLAGSIAAVRPAIQIGVLSRIAYSSQNSIDVIDISRQIAKTKTEVSIGTDLIGPKSNCFSSDPSVSKIFNAQ